jgi:regulatory protein
VDGAACCTFAKPSNWTKARKHAFTLLRRKALSRHELIERLMRKGHGASIAEQIADEFIADGWLDEATLAREIVQQQLARKPAAERLLLQKLRSRGIEEDVAQRIAQEELRSTNTVDAAMELAEKRYKSMRSLPSLTAARRLAGALHRRGFDEETIDTVLNRMGLHDAE